MSDLLTDVELEELTGYRQPDAQVRVLRGHGLRPVIRKDGRPRVTWEALARAMVTTQTEAQNDGTPNFEFLRPTG